MAKLPDADGLAGHYDWLATALADLQGRPRAVLLERLIEHDLAGDRAAPALRHAEKLAADFPRRPSAWFMRAAALQANQRNMEAARALSALARRTSADDPVGMGARLGLAALFIELEQGEKACAMRMKIFARPTANDNWAAAAQAFPILKGRHKRTGALLLVSEMLHAGEQHGKAPPRRPRQSPHRREIEPPGCMTAVAPASAAASKPSANGKKRIRGDHRAFAPKRCVRASWLRRHPGAFCARQCANCPSGSFVLPQCRPWRASLA